MIKTFNKALLVCCKKKKSWEYFIYFSFSLFQNLWSKIVFWKRNESKKKKISIITNKIRNEYKKGSFFFFLCEGNQEPLFQISKLINKILTYLLACNSILFDSHNITEISNLFHGWNQYSFWIFVFLKKIEIQSHFFIQKSSREIGKVIEFEIELILLTKYKLKISLIHWTHFWTLNCWFFLWYSTFYFIIIINCFFKKKKKIELPTVIIKSNVW